MVGAISQHRQNCESFFVLMKNPTLLSGEDEKGDEKGDANLFTFGYLLIQPPFKNDRGAEAYTLIRDSRDLCLPSFGTRDLQQGIEPFPASHGNVYRVRAMDVNTPVDNFDAVIAKHGSGLLAKV